MESTTIRPAMETLRELDSGMLLDKLALAIHDATGAVQHTGKGAKILLTIDITPLTKQNLKEPVISMGAEILTKLPKPDGDRAVFYIDGNGNPTTQQQRQPELGLRIADTPGASASA